MSKLNIEIKAKCKSHKHVRNILKTGNAKYIGTDHQVDSYFNVNNGRLKLREGNIENNLIHYNREDKEGPKQSDYSLYKTTPNSLLKPLMTKALGLNTVVDKKREIYMIDNVKFHLDNVKNLGKFIEIEVNGTDKSNKQNLMEQCKFYLNLFNINNNDLIPVSYSDMLIQQLITL